MPLNFYPEFCALDEEESRQFRLLTEEDDGFTSAITASAEYWRSHLRPKCRDTVQCRRLFLARAAIKTAGCGIHFGFGRKVLMALALAVADKVEERVAELDREDENAA
jgi:hypothetical protein